MNRLALPISIIALLLCAFTFFHSRSTSELVYVDINKLLEGYERTPVEKQAFEKMANTLKANVDSLMVNWQDN